MRTTTSQPWHTVGAQAPTYSLSHSRAGGRRRAFSSLFSRVSIALAPAHFGYAHKFSTHTHAHYLTFSQPYPPHAHRGHAPPHTSHTLTGAFSDQHFLPISVKHTLPLPARSLISMVFPMFSTVSPPNVGNRFPTFTIYLLDMYYYVYKHSSKCKLLPFSHFAMCHSGKRKHVEHALTLCEGADGDSDESFKYHPRVTVMTDSLSNSSILSGEVIEC